MPLNDSQIERYSRQIILPELGGIGQERLLAARVRIAGENASVDWAALYLAAAGVGALWLPASADAVTREIASLVSECRVTLTSAAAEADVTLALDATPDSGGRLVIAHATGDEGWLSVVDPADPSSACVGCTTAVPSPKSQVPGPGGAQAVIGLLAVTETLKLLLDLGTPLVGRRLAYDAARQTFNQEPVSCGEGCKSPTQRRVSAVR